MRVWAFRWQSVCNKSFEGNAQSRLTRGMERKHVVLLVVCGVYYWMPRCMPSCDRYNHSPADPHTFVPSTNSKTPTSRKTRTLLLLLLLDRIQRPTKPSARAHTPRGERTHRLNPPRLFMYCLHVRSFLILAPPEALPSLCLPCGDDD